MSANKKADEDTNSVSSMQGSSEHASINSIAEDAKTYEAETTNSITTSTLNGNTSNKKNSNNDTELKNEDDTNLSLKPVNTRLWSPKLESHRRKILMRFVYANLFIGAFCIAVLSIYWGASARTTKYLHKVKVIAVIEDDDTVFNNNDGINNDNNKTILPLTNILPSLINENQLTWNPFYNTSSFLEKYNLNSSEQISDRLTKLVYDEKYWFAVHVKPNLTMSLYDSLTNSTYPSFNSTDLLSITYESGRDPTNLKSYMLPPILKLQSKWQHYYKYEYLPSLLNNITLDHINTVNWANMGDLTFQQIDYRPFTSRALMSPLQVGLIYLLILTLFQFSLLAPIHVEMAKVLKPQHILLYRFLMSWSTYFFLSLFLCTISAIFQIDFTLAFGKGGFVIYWFSTMLIMGAVGGMNEIVVGLIVVFAQPYMPAWIITWIILNISSSFYPMALSNVFYRYGYAMPLHNAVDIFRVIFLDLSKSKMGRNYGVLVAWIALNTILLPLTLRLIGKHMQKQNAQVNKDGETQ